jgi:uncharacterized Ntn-hydrolase superfamily protein
LGAEQVFVGDRRTQQGAALTVGAAGVGGFRLLEGQLFGEADETVELRIELGDTRQQDLRVSSSEENFLSARPRAISARVI